MTQRIKRDTHPNFINYMKFIAEHPNYAGMPFLYKKDGSIRWVTSRGSEVGQARLEWWDKKRKELKLEKGVAWISKTARANHPTGEKVCQICGTSMSLDYIYPNKRNTLSPGAMSNAPDRLDGYHSYNLCCRGIQDTGRHKSNLDKYGEDRRAFENWSEGDWKAASWLMKEFQKHKISPDHLGPISLGFSHRPKFRPTTRAVNSARNNRMTHEDVRVLIEEELSEPIISAHSKALWDLLKHRVTNDDQALQLGKLMRENMHIVLSIFSIIAENGHEDFLVKNFLHPEHAHYSIAFTSFDPLTGSYTEMVKTPGKKKQYINNEKRYIRIALESLKKYSLKENRNIKNIFTKNTQESLAGVLVCLKAGEDKKALVKLFKIFESIAQELSKRFIEEM